jgi:HEAT repeat protein
MAHKTPRGKGALAGPRVLAKGPRYNPTNCPVDPLNPPGASRIMVTRRKKTSEPMGRLLLTVVCLLALREIGTAAAIEQRSADTNHEVRIALGNLSNHDAAVRKAAAETLERAGHAAWWTASQVLQRLREEKTPEVRGALAAALGAVAMEPGSLPALVLIALDTGEDDGVRAQAAAALGSLRDPAAIAVLKRLLRDKVAEVRLGAVRGTGRLLLDPRQPHTEDVTAALSPLSRKREEVVAMLVPFLKDRDAAVRKAVVEAFGRARAGRDHLHELEKDPSPEVRDAVAQALSRMQGRE